MRLTAALLDMYEDAGIRVIKVGLHAERELEGALVAGPYHPAFRELCEARRLRGRVDALLEGRPGGDYELLCPKALTSKLTGQKRENVDYWQNRGYNVRIKAGDETEITLRPAGPYSTVRM